MQTKVPEVLTVAETAKALKLSPSRARQLIDRGVIPTAQVVEGGQHRIHADAIERLLEPEAGLVSWEIRLPVRSRADRLAEGASEASRTRGAALEARLGEGDGDRVKSAIRQDRRMGRRKENSPRGTGP